MEDFKVKNVLLVHGCFVDASSWTEIIINLQKAGLNVRAVQNPLTSLADDVGLTKQASNFMTLKVL